MENKNTRKTYLMTLAALTALTALIVVFTAGTVSASAIYFADTNAPALAISPAQIAATNELTDAREIVSRMGDNNLPTERINDLLEIAKNAYDEAIMIAATNKITPNFETFNAKINDFRNIADLEISSHDELVGLKERIDKAAPTVPDIKPAMDIYDSAQKELADQRFERVMDLIQQADEKILDLASIQTRAEAMYDAAAANIWGFLNKYKYELAALIIIPVLVYLVFRKRLRAVRLRQKIEACELRKETLMGEIKRVQEDYFVKGKLAEGAYGSKTAVFAEMIRDLAREIAVLKEEEKRINSPKMLIEMKQKEIKKKNKTKIKPKKWGAE